MKKNTLLFLLFLLFLINLSVFSQDLTGRWSGTLNVMDNKHHLVLHI